MQLESLITKIAPGKGDAAALVRYVTRTRKSDKETLEFELITEDGEIVKMQGPACAGYSASVLRVTRPYEARGPEARHVIISCAASATGVEAKLGSAGMDWLRTYAPGRAAVKVKHRHNGIVHLHLAVSNYDASGRGLNFSRTQARAMANAVFTDVGFCRARTRTQYETLVASGEVTPPVGGVQRRRPRYKPSKPQAIAVKRGLIACLLAGQKLDHMIAAGLVTVVRWRDGKPSTIAYEGVRIRLSTLDSLIDRERVWRTAEPERRATRSLALSVVDGTPLTKLISDGAVTVTKTDAYGQPFEVEHGGVCVKMSTLQKVISKETAYRKKRKIAITTQQAEKAQEVGARKISKLMREVSAKKVTFTTIDSTFNQLLR